MSLNFMYLTGSTSLLIRSCPGAGVALQQLLAGQLHVQGQVLSQHSSLEQAAGSQPQQQSGFALHQHIADVHQQLQLPGAFETCTGLLPRLGLRASGLANNTSSCPVVAGLWQCQRHYARPCSEAVDDELAAAAAGPGRRRRSRTTISSDPAEGAPAAAAAAAAVDAASKEDTTPEAAAASSRRRGTTESRALLRRTTESRAAIEDVAVMGKSQLMRRNKAWLQHECWSRKLPYDGLKPDLVQQLLDWQETDAGIEAAAVALADAEAGSATAAAASSSSAAAEGLQELQGAEQQLDGEAGGSSNSSSSGSRRRRRSTGSTAISSSGSSNSAGASQVPGHKAAAAVGVAVLELPQQPPRNAAAAAADSLTALLQQLQEQPDNAALLAVARNSLELHVRHLLTHSHASGSSTGSSSWSSDTGSGSWVSAAATAAASRTAALQEAAADLASCIHSASSPASIAALATACYSREVQNPVLAAAMSEAVASVALQLGPQEVYRVLRLIVEHLGEAVDADHIVSNGDGTEVAAGWARGEAVKTLRRGFQVLAQALIGCCSLLAPMQLAEAVALLARHEYDDAWGLWLVSKEAADRLADFEPCDMVLLLDAVAGMCVADDALCRGVAEAVAAKRAAYNAAQLQAVRSSLQRMGYAGQV